ncbi:MAG TPA: hypothetical protein VN764_01695, partial [Polyangiaceae bacterium]|nr:hypothetical protein [Polyangiaceae bacterium]
IYLAELALFENDLSAAKDALSRAVGILETVPVMRRIAHALLADVCASLGQAQEAGNLAELALDGLDADTRLPFSETLVRVGAAEGLRAAGEPERAAEILYHERNRIVELVGERRHSRALDASTEQLAEKFLHGSPERAYLMQLDLSEWTAGEGSYIEHLARSHPGASSGPVSYLRSDAVSETNQELELILAEPRVTRALGMIGSHYEKLAHAFAEVLDRNNATYCHYASIVSKNTQQLVESEELRGQVMSSTCGAGGTLLGVSKLNALLLGVFGLRQKLQAAGLAAIERAALLFLNHRRKLHEELTPVLARFIMLVDQYGASSDLTALTDQLSAHEGGQESVKEALYAYYESYQVQAPAAKAQLILLGNCSMVLYEQTRLQRHLSLALEMPIEQMTEEFLHEALPGWMPHFLARFVMSRTRGYMAQLAATWRNLAHRLVMKVSVLDPAAIAWDDRAPRRLREFPLELRELTEKRLVSMSQRFDPQFGTSHPGGKNNWSDLRDRMGYILEMLRAGQQDLPS